MDAFDYLESEVNKDIKSIEDALSAGNAKDYAEYQYLCGKIRGLLAAQAIILDLKKRTEQDDE